MAVQVGQAYVQILPSMKGIGQKIGDALKGQTEKPGTDAGSSLGGALVGTVKKVIAAAGIGKALSSAITEGAALEQSIGGIETLFKDSADQVKTAAAEAYRTAGMSANAYMELTTSFAAGLLQSLGGDTAKAASVADMAMQDMSDNANKMGTDMGSIQNAYQGFAKQNYTMLDNLKLGYGGTKTEMERLLADAQKLTGVKYDIDNLADVYSAIHVIQGELDITGTTAKEAATTISGSLSAVKAAFSNVLGQLTLGQDVTPALNALAETFTTFLVGNLLPAIVNIVSALPGALLTIIETGVPQLATALADFVPQAAAGIVQGLPQLVTTAGQLLTEMCAAIVTGLPGVVSAGGQMLSSLVQGIQQNFPQIVTSAASAVAQLVFSIGQHLPEVLDSGLRIIGELVAGLLRAIPKIIAAIPQLISAIKDGFTGYDWAGLGRSIIDGIASGITAAVGTVVQAAKDVAGSVVNAAKNVLGIHSPSRVMRDEVGRFIPSGVAEGILDGTDTVDSAMETLSDRTTARLRMGLTADTSVAFGRAASTSTGAEQAGTDVVDALYAIASQMMTEMRALRGDVQGIEVGDDVIGRAAKRYSQKMGIAAGSYY